MEVCVKLRVRVEAALEVRLAVEVIAALRVELLEPVGEGVVDAEPVLVCEGEELRMLAMLRPRKVMLDTAASASPDSHSVDRSTPLEAKLEGMSCVMLT